MGFKKWLIEMGLSRGLGGGLTPPMERPDLHATALADYHGKNSSDPRSPKGKLPPVIRSRVAKKKSSGLNTD